MSVKFVGLLLLAFQTPAFEVATVKPADPARMFIGDLMSYPGGRVVGIRCTLDNLVLEALGIHRYQLKGGPAWMRDERFDLDARSPASSVSAKSTLRRVSLNAEQRQMLLALLVDRFQLKYHREMREGPVYFLVRTRKKLKLEEPKHPDHLGGWAGDPEGGIFHGGGIAGDNISMPQLAARLGGYLERPVVDRTGHQGSYDFLVKYEPDDANPDVTSSILVSIQQLGLKLEAGKGPVETIVIDRAERPAGN
ncbi:MAG TPA: TIGR03435 family protein [Bryobacteraceae bacterium]|nr:TIGR03435 family protein [Bryobacteraceae bacterium]